MGTCQICGSKKSLGGNLCQHMCFWILEGWLGWNARTKQTAVMDRRAARFADAIISYPKLIAAAKSLGWTGRENAGTFVAAAKAAKAGAR